MRRDAEVVAQSRREKKPSPALLTRIHHSTRHLQLPTPTVTDLDANELVIGSDPEAELPPGCNPVQDGVSGEFGNTEPNVVLSGGYAPLDEGLDGEGRCSTHRSVVAGKSSLP